MKRIDGNTRVVVLIIVIVVIILGGVGYFAWTQLFASKTQTNTQDTDVIVDPSTVPPIATAETKTYSVNNYSFDYVVADWTPSENSSSVVVRSKNYAQSGAEVTITTTKTTKTLSQLKQDITSAGDGTLNQNVLDIKVGGKEAFSYYSTDKSPSYHTVLVQDGSSYDIAYRYKTSADADKYKNGYDVITSTFKLK